MAAEHAPALVVQDNTSKLRYLPHETRLSPPGSMQLQLWNAVLIFVMGCNPCRYHPDPQLEHSDHDLAGVRGSVLKS